MNKKPQGNIFWSTSVTLAVEKRRSWSDRETLLTLSCFQIWKQKVPNRNVGLSENVCIKQSAVSSLHAKAALFHNSHSILHLSVNVRKMRLTWWCWRGCAWHAGTVSQRKASSPSSGALESSRVPKCSLEFDKFTVSNSCQSALEALSFYTTMSPWFTFLIWGLRDTVHAKIIWISKLFPVLGWNTEQALNHLERKIRSRVFIWNGNKRQSIYNSATQRRPSLNFTFGCLLVSCRMVMGSGSGTAWPTRVGPNTLARFLTSILVSMLLETLWGHRQMKMLTIFTHL